MNKEYENTLLYMKKEKKNKNYIIRRIFKWKIIFIKFYNVDTKGYNRFTKPWAQPLINFSKRYIPVYTWVYKGYKVIKNEWNLIKNSYKTTRNYILNKHYQKNWVKTKFYASKTFKVISH